MTEFCTGGVIAVTDTVTGSLIADLVFALDTAYAATV